MTADAIEMFLRERQMPLVVENGGMCPVPLQECRGIEHGFDSRNPTQPTQ